MKRKHAPVTIALLAMLVACSSDNTNSSSSSSSSGSSSGTGTASIDPPTITKVEKMTGALHVSWTLPSSKCDNIEGERMAHMPDGSMMENYKVVFTEPGTADNKMDASATDDMTYMYRLRCKVGSQYSQYSNEMGADPKK